MTRFLEWFETAQPDPVLKAGVVHLWFASLHQFDDGNGRIARAIADLALARAEGTAQRFYSMSAQIRTERNAYYDMLESTKKGDTDITPWLLWFIGCLDRAFDRAETILASVMRKARFWESVATLPMSVSARSSTDCSMDSRASSPRPSGRLLPRHRPIRRCAISTISSSAASWSRSRGADAAPVMPWHSATLTSQHDEAPILPMFGSQPRAASLPS